MWFGLNALDYTLWSLNLAACITLLFLLVRGFHYQDAIFFRSRMYRSLSPFSIYIGFCVLRTIALGYVKHHCAPETYYTVYYSAIAMAGILITLTVLEVAWEVFGPYHTVPIRAVINGCGALIVVTVLLLALSEILGYHPPQPYWDAVLTMDRRILSIAFGGLAVTVFIAYWMNMPWNDKAKSICAGLAFVTLVQAVNQHLTVPGSQARFHRPYGMLAFFVAQIFWIYEFRKPARPVTEVTDAFINALQQSLNQIGNGKRVPTVN